MTAMRAAGTPPSLEKADARIASVLADPSVRHWVKDALIAGCASDPVDAAHDAAFIASLLGDRVDAMLAAFSRR